MNLECCKNKTTETEGVELTETTTSKKA